MSLVLCVAALLPGSGSADKPEKIEKKRSAHAAPADACLDDLACNELYETARRSSDAGQFEAALTYYQRAFALQPVPWLLVNIGRMQQKSGHPQQAILTYRQFLRDPAALEDPETASRANTYVKQAEFEAAAEIPAAQTELKPISIVNPAVTSHPRPVYKKWWFWVAIGGAAVTAGAVTAGIVVANRPPSLQVFTY